MSCLVYFPPSSRFPVQSGPVWDRHPITCWTQRGNARRRKASTPQKKTQRRGEAAWRCITLLEMISLNLERPIPLEEIPPPDLSLSLSSSQLYYQLSTSRNNFLLNLTLQGGLLSRQFRVEYWKRGRLAWSHPYSPHCHYAGHLQDQPRSSTVALSNCNGLVRGKKSFSLQGARKKTPVKSSETEMTWGDTMSGASTSDFRICKIV